MRPSIVAQNGVPVGFGFDLDLHQFMHGSCQQHMLRENTRGQSTYGWDFSAAHRPCVAAVTSTAGKVSTITSNMAWRRRHLASDALARGRICASTARCGRNPDCTRLWLAKNHSRNYYRRATRRQKMPFRINILMREWVFPLDRTTLFIANNSEATASREFFAVRPEVGMQAVHDVVARGAASTMGDQSIRRRESTSIFIESIVRVKKIVAPARSRMIDMGN